MRIKRFAAAIVCGAVMLTALAGCGDSSVKESSGSAEKQQSQTQKGEVKSSMNSVKKLGRTYSAEDGSLWLGLSGTGAEFDFTGTRLTVTLQGNAPNGQNNIARAAVFVDGECKSDLLVRSGSQQIEIEGKGSESVNVRIIKLSESQFSCCGITDIDAHGGTVSPAAEKARKIEFIGDSITCGYGVDDTDLSHGFTTASEDCTKSYAIKTAQLLGADHSLVSYSGYGVISGYTDDGEKSADRTVGTLYEKYAGTEDSGFDGIDPSKLDWDFNGFVPQVIVINLGTNDSSYTGSDSARQQEFVQGYIGLLKQVRAKNPAAKIFCVLGTMGDLLCGSVKEAAAQYSARTGDTDIVTFDLPVQDIENDGAAINYHPTEKTYDKAAKLLSEKIRSEMGW